MKWSYNGNVLFTHEGPVTTDHPGTAIELARWHNNQVSDRPLLVLFGYGGPVGQDIVDRHSVYWQRGNCDIMLVSGVDAALYPGGFTWGRNEPAKQGEELIERHVQTFRHCLRMRYESFYFLEADAIVLGELPVPDQAQVFFYQNADPSYHATRYAHWPWVVRYSDLQILVDAAERVPFHYHYGVPDRWMGAVIEESGLDVKHTSLSFSCNRLDTPELIATARKYIANGALVVHGIKEQREIDAILC